MKLIYLPIWILFLFGIFYKIRIVSAKEIQGDYLAPSNTGRVKGILALIILFDHIAALIGTKGDIIFEIFHAIGFLAVALFFFFSGYSTEKQRLLRDDYLTKKFVLRKFVSLIIPMYIVNIVYLVAEGSVDIWELQIQHWWEGLLYIFDISGQYVINPPTWYIRSLFLLLVVYFILHKFINKQKWIDVAMFTALLIITIYRAVTWNEGTGQDWGMLFCFLAGNIWANNEEKITEFIKARYWKLLVISVLFTGAFCVLFLYNYDNYVGKLLWRNIATVCFVIMVAILLMTIRLQNELTGMLGKISLEIYLMHSLIIWYITRYDSEVMKVYISVIGTLLLACIIQPVISKIVKRMNRLL